MIVQNHISLCVSLFSQSNKNIVSYCHLRPNRITNITGLYVKARFFAFMTSDRKYPFIYLKQAIMLFSYDAKSNRLKSNNIE